MDGAFLQVTSGERGGILVISNVGTKIMCEPAMCLGIQMEAHVGTVGLVERVQKEYKSID